jgi:hypothetical protein
MIIFDLDGTLADCEHRRHFVNKKKGYECDRYCNLCFNGTAYPIRPCGNCSFKPDWKAFYEACDKDKPIEPVIRMFRYQMTRFNTINQKINWQIWSGRCESVRQKTIDWLDKYIITIDWDIERLKMRPIGDNTPDEILKEKWLDEAIAQGKKIDFVFDDRKKVVDMWIRRGIFVFDVSQGKGDF